MFEINNQQIEDIVYEIRDDFKFCTGKVETILKESGKWIIQDGIELLVEPSEQWKREYQPETPLETIKLNKLNELKEACKKSIFAGFYSAASGKRKLYGFDEQEQTNMNHMMLSILLGNVGDSILYKAKGEVLGEYTPEQFKLIYSDAQSHRAENVRKYDGLKQKVLKAKTGKKIEDVTWN